MVYIEIKHLYKIVKRKELLHDVNLTLDRGKIYGLLDREGSAKTVLLQMICGLIRPTSGSITVNGKPLYQDFSFPDNLGAVIEAPGFCNFLTGFENLKILAEIRRSITDEIIRETLTRVGLDAEDGRVCKNYSQGMKQRLALAQALMENPDLLILDEPMHALGVEGRALIHQLLLSEKGEGTTILFASRSKEEIQLLSDEEIEINDGYLKENVG